MNGLQILLLYIVCLFLGFCGGLLGCLFFKRKERKEAKKHNGEVVISDLVQIRHENGAEMS